MELPKGGVAEKNYWVLVSVSTINNLLLSKRAGDTIAIHGKGSEDQREQTKLKATPFSYQDFPF